MKGFYYETLTICLASKIWKMEPPFDIPNPQAKAFSHSRDLQSRGLWGSTCVRTFARSWVSLGLQGPGTVDSLGALV